MVFDDYWHTVILPALREKGVRDEFSVSLKPLFEKTWNDCQAHNLAWLNQALNEGDGTYRP
jgi:hypothetical protein